MEVFFSVDLKPIPKALREEVFQIHGRICVYCEAAPADTIDHVIPLDRGGHSFLDNLLPACRSCNFRKGNLLPDEFQPNKWQRCLGPKCKHSDHWES